MPSLGEVVAKLGSEAGSVLVCATVRPIVENGRVEPGPYASFPIMGSV